MTMWKRCALGLALFTGLTSFAAAQIPGVPGAPSAAGAGAPAAAAGPSNIWSFFSMTPEQKAAKKLKFCQSKIGQLINNSLAPAGALTGGIIGPCCPTIPPADLLQPPASATGAAAQIKADEAAAKQRRAAVRYLGTVDCNYWPEAQAALINALRADRNECVRLEAACSLGRGCCCNRLTMKALSLTVEGSRADGNPAETSDRVRASAHTALTHCLAIYAEVEAVPLKPVPGTGPGPRTLTMENDKQPKAGVTPASYYKSVQAGSTEDVVRHARRVIEKSTSSKATVRGDRSLTGLFRSAYGATGSAVPVQETASPPPSETLGNIHRSSATVQEQVEAQPLPTQGTPRPTGQESATKVIRRWMQGVAMPRIGKQGPEAVE